MHRIIGAAASVLLLTACSGGAAEPSPAETPSSADVAAASAVPSATPSEQDPAPETPLRFGIIGHCSTEGGTLVGMGYGFTPGGEYLTEAYDPKGNPYTEFDNTGTADAQGRITTWRWPCTGDPAGVYEVTIFDITTTRSQDDEFEILPPPTP